MLFWKDGGRFLDWKDLECSGGCFFAGQKKSKVRKEFPLLSRLREEKSSRLKGGIYHRTQIDLTYNSNHIEGSRLSHEQTRYIYEMNTIGISDESVNVDDIVETVNHFRCIDYIIDHAQDKLTEGMIKEIHRILKTGTSDSRKSWFNVGEYKKLPNEVGGNQTCPPEKVHSMVSVLLKSYNSKRRRHWTISLTFTSSSSQFIRFRMGMEELDGLSCSKNACPVG